jgi:hypothetical protein
MSRRDHATDMFKDRMPDREVPSSATFPRSLRLPTPTELADGVVIAYGNANFTVYRAFIDRLRPGERFRMETHLSVYVMSRSDFDSGLPGLVNSPSYQTGSPSMPDRCYYVVGTPPAAASRFLVRRPA